MSHPKRVQAPEETRVMDDLRRIVRVLRESSRASEGRLGVSGAQLFVLKTLSMETSLSLNALAARTCTHQSSVSVVVKRLVKRGLVRRAVSDTDRRGIELSLTKPGRELTRRAPGAGQDRLIEGIESLTRRERVALATALHRLVEVMHIAGEEPPMFFEE